jgi:hypothetical protein
MCICSELTLVEILQNLASEVQTDGLKNLVNVDRDEVLVGGYQSFGRQTFNPKRLLSVRFSGENGIDTGGLTREFLRLAMVSIKESTWFVGPTNSKMIQLDYKGNRL